MNGKGHDDPTTHDGKWHRIFDMMRDKKLDILALNETHLDDVGVDRLREKFGKRLWIFNSPNPTTPTAKEGVALVLNKEMTNVNDVQCRVLIPGRAVILSVAWHAKLTLSYLAVYAPNDRRDNERFWDVLYTQILSDTSIPIPDAMGGDLNAVEDPLDALPMRREHAGVSRALRRLVSTLQMEDGWREHNKNKLGYTHRQLSSGTQSRIDRIYASKEIMNVSQNWEIEVPNFKTDHKLVTMEITSPNAPHIGRGRATWPKHLIAGDRVLNEAIKAKRSVPRNIKIYLMTIGGCITIYPIITDQYL
ncbi:DNase I-like protein [Schizophyllum commune Tattone D]|nr:DNase I-like protein [Schizophyllum commune Tattone D]